MNIRLKTWIRRRLARWALSHGYDLAPVWQLKDRPLIRHLQALFTQYEIDCVFDVGANRGQYYDLLRNEIGFKGTVLSFEPVAQYFTVLQARAAKEAHWEVFNVALGGGDSTATINVTRSPGLNSFLAPRSDVVAGFWSDDGVIATETVDVKQLDGIFGALQNRHGFKAPYLKLDTQGYDLEVLAGARECAIKMRALQTEASIQPIYAEMPDYRRTLSSLESLDFEISGMFTVTHDKALRVIEFDCVMINKRFAEPR